MRRLATALVLLAPAAWADTVSTAADRAGLGLTVSQDGRTLVRDRRMVPLDKGPGTLVIEDVAAEARPGSATLAGAGIVVREQGFDGALDGARLLAPGREVTVTWADGREERARVLAAGPVPVFQIGSRVVAAQPARVSLDALPAGLRPLPSWRGQVEAAAAGRREVELSYDTAGLGWQADYAADLAEESLTLGLWATLSNTSGADFPAAQVRVVAGMPARPHRPMKAARAEMAMTADAGLPEAVGPHHVYAVPQPVSLRHGETRQVALLGPLTLPVERALVFDPLPVNAWAGLWADPLVQRPTLQLRFKNTLGQPLPGGSVRVTQRAKDGTPVVLGEARLDPTPDGAPARLILAESFDVTARRSQTDFQRVSPEVTEAAWEVRLANGAAAPAQVVVREGFQGDWLVVEENAKHKKDAAFAASWSVTVPAKGETVLKYRVRVKGA